MSHGYAESNAVKERSGSAVSNRVSGVVLSVSRSIPGGGPLGGGPLGGGPLGRTGGLGPLMALTGLTVQQSVKSCSIL